MKKMLIGGLWLLSLSACQYLDRDFMDPQIDVVNLELLPSEGLEQTIRVSLRLTNPNPYPLPLKNLSYQLVLDNNPLVSGSTHELSDLAADESKVFRVDAHLNLFRSALWFKKLLDNNAEKVSYRLEAKLNTGLTFAPAVRMTQDGEIALNP